MTHHKYTDQPSEKGTLLDDVFFLAAMKFARDHREKGEVVIPTIFLQVTDQKGVIVHPILLPNDSSEKRLVLYAFGRHIRDTLGSISHAAIVTEAWFVDASQAPTATDLPPSEHPCRQEAIVLGVRNASGQSALVIQPFVKDSANVVTWEEPQINRSGKDGFALEGMLDELFVE